jgi:hypothetical protein
MEDLGQAVWVAELDDGRLFYQDDGRPGCEAASAWSRLKASKERVVGLSLCFRSRTLRDIVPRWARGYYFSRSVVVFDGQSNPCYVLGHVEGDRVVLKTVMVPQLLFLHGRERPLSHCNEEQLIVY